VVKWRWIAAVALIGSVSGRAGELKEPPANRTAVVFVSADLVGYLGPCGCSEAMRGGIDRAAEQIAQARAANPNLLFVDGGDALFGRRSLSPAEIPQETLKAKTIAQSFKLSGLATRAVGELDDARGPAFRKSLKLPEIPSGGSRLFDQLGLKVAIVAARSERELLAASSRARRNGAQIVLALYDQTLEEAQKISANPDLEATVLFATRLLDELDGEENRLVRSRVPVARIQSKGRSLARLDISYGQPGAQFELQKTSEDREREISSLDQRLELLKKELNTPGQGKEIKRLKQAKFDELVKRREAIASAPIPGAAGNAFAIRFIPLEPTLPSNPEVKALITRYERNVGKLNLAWARAHGKDCARPGPGEAAYVGNEACRECHAEAFPVWEKSKHAHAYQTLADQGRQYDLSCIGCHVIGYGKPGGVCRVDRVEGRKDVGCENCHGPGSIHSDNPDSQNILAKPVKADCVRCHNPENSSHFDFSTYLPQILGPGHGGKPTSPIGADAG
jgi:hypothetical protein